jgi:hypothetical protein
VTLLTPFYLLAASDLRPLLGDIRLDVAALVLMLLLSAFFSGQKRLSRL